MNLPGRIYPLTSSRGWSGAPLRQVELFLSCGIRFLQLREKNLSDRNFHDLALEASRRVRRQSATLIINDRVDIALAAGAQGAHLGPDDLPVYAARLLMGGGRILGLSTHSEEEFLQAQQLDVDYVAIGPIYESPTKTGAYTPIGLEALRPLIRQKRHPMVAIGGINLERAVRLWDLGVDSVAVISDLLQATDPARRIEEYLEAAPV